MPTKNRKITKTDTAVVKKHISTKMRTCEDNCGYEGKEYACPKCGSSTREK